MKKLAYGLAFAHLLLITLVIFHVLDNIAESNPRVEKSLAVLCGINFSVWRYGFFSPDVGRSNEVEIKIYGEGGKEQTFSTLHDFRFFLSNRDLAMRFYGFKVYNVGDTIVQALCARSVAARMMNLSPDTWKVDYTIRSIRYPTLDSFRLHRPVEIKELYTTEFILKPDY